MRDPVRIAVLLVLGNVWALLAADTNLDRPVLEKARELGRERSRFLQETRTKPETNIAVPKANLALFRERIGPVLKQNCIGCHGPRKSEGRLRVDKLNADLLTGPDVDRWREIYRVLSNSEMPPKDEPAYELADADRGRVVDWLTDELNKASLLRRNNVQHSSFRRMTKYEYDYALQDLLGLPYQLAGRLPPETASEDGFKNSSQMLQMSAMQFQFYREIGLKALKRATVHGARPEPVRYVISMQEEMDNASSGNKAKTFDKNDEDYRKNRTRPHLLHRETGQGIHFSGGNALPRSDAVAGHTPAVSPVVLVMPRSSELKMNLDRFLPDEGTMRVRIRAGRSTTKDTEFASLRLVFSAHTSNDARFSEVISQRDIPVTEPVEQSQFIDFDIPLSDIQRNPFRKLETTFPRRDEFLHIRNVSNAKNQEEEPLSVLVDYIEIIAPFYEQWPPKTHTRIFFESENAGDEEVYGREVLAKFARRAWRRAITSQEVDRLMALFARYRPEFATFEEAMLEVLATVLAAPEFLYLTQKVSADHLDAPVTIRDVELASRLSFFLWSSIPDDELLGLAAQEQLKEPKVLAAQVKRMLADPRSRRFSENFVQQWLGLDALNSVTHITDKALRRAVQEEPIAFFTEVLEHDRSVMDFVHSDYAVVNERLAAHYQIPGVYGPHFRKVPIAVAANRGGILAGAGVLAMNSDGKDSNPLKRGVWMLERFLHDPPPPPPADVPEVDLTDPEILKMTLKERIADHRNKPACASCHARIDPWGIAFENYDALGVYRTHVNEKLVDANSQLFNNQELAGMNGLKRYLLMDRQDQFASALVHKMTSYALGRPLSFADHAAINGITVQFRKRGDRRGDLVRLIIGSELFHAK